MRHFVPLVFFATLLAQINCSTKEESKVTLCEGDFCDTNWTPFSNMVSALRGYNILQGNPVQNDGDPGFSGQIFVPAVRNKTIGKYHLHNRITASKLSFCHRNLKSNYFTTLNSYRNYLAASLSHGGNLQVGVSDEILDTGDKATIPKPFTGAFDHSRDFMELRRFFSDQGGMVSLAVSTFTMYEVQLNSLHLPPFTSPLKIALGRLYRASEKSYFAKKFLFERFINQFGTHFLTSAKMGAQYISRAKYSKTAGQAMDAETLKECNNKEGARVFSIQLEEDRNNCTTSDSRKLKSLGLDATVSETITQGASLTDIKSWNVQKFVPVPLKFELTPIVNLMTEEYIDAKNLEYHGKKVRSLEIRKWFLPMYFDFCTSREFVCPEEGGCGTHHNEPCPIYSICTFCPEVLTIDKKLIDSKKANQATATSKPKNTTSKPTTASEPTTTSSITPKPIMLAPTTKAVPQCMMLPTPLKDAYGFGMSEESYVEFRVHKRNYDAKSQYELHFYTYEPSGILLTVSMRSVCDYEAIYLADGKVYYIFNAGAGALTIASTETYNDGKWHKVSTRRERYEGILTIDNKLIGSKKASPYATRINEITSLYFGGFPSGALLPPTISKSLLVPMKGGIKNIKSFNEALVPAKKVGVTPAYDGLGIDDGISFGYEDGYVSKYKHFKVGQVFKISMDVRSVNKCGYLLYSTGYGEILSIRIRSSGKVTAVCNNGGGKFSVTVEPKKSICSGEFTSLKVVKNLKTLTLTVGDTTESVTTTKGSTSADTSSPLYFGGFPGKRPKNYASFTGCMRNVVINDKPVQFTDDDVTTSGAVMRGCVAAEKSEIWQPSL